MTLRKVGSLFDQSIKVWGFHVRESETCNRVISLLIRDDKNDVGLLRSHQIYGELKLHASAMLTK